VHWECTTIGQRRRFHNQHSEGLLHFDEQLSTLQRAKVEADMKQASTSEKQAPQQKPFNVAAKFARAAKRKEVLVEQKSVKAKHRELARKADRVKDLADKGNDVDAKGSSDKGEDVEIELQMRDTRMGRKKRTRTTRNRLNAAYAASLIAEASNQVG
jgi:hypothetical protein